MSRQIHAVYLKCLFSLVLLLAIALPALGQSTAAVTGVVQDTSDARIPHANVKLINTQTGTESDSRTNNDGDFTLPNVMPGHYILQIERDGFDTTQLTGITLNVGDNKSVVIRMKVGSKNETVTVDGSGLTLNTTDASVSTVIDRKFVENIPLNGRSFQDLISITPGVTTQSPQTQYQQPGENGDFSVNGQRTESNYYLIDGVSGNVNPGAPIGGPQASSSGSIAASTALGTTQSLVSVDALQEFRVSSSSYSAEFGHTPGAQFSFVTRSGTDTPHGSVYDYLRNNFFDANDWFNDHNGKPIAPLRQNDFGGTLGGPVFLPHLYDGSHRTFLFGSYEGLRLTQPQAAAVQYVPDPFMREQAPTALQPILNAYPIANGPDFGTRASPNLAEFIEPYSLPSRIDSTSLRLDQTFSAKTSAFFRLSYTPSSISTRSLSVVNTARLNTQTYTAGLTHTFSSAIVDAFHVGYSRGVSSTKGIIDSFGGATPINLGQVMGFGGENYTDPQFGINISGAGYASLETLSAQNASRQWNITDTLDIASGKHQIKAGIDYRRIVTPYTPPSPALGALYLDGQSVITNSSFYVFIEDTLPATPVFNEFAAFVQDNWRIVPQLTFSFGVRWEVNPPPTGENGNAAYTLLGNVFDPATLSVAPRGTPLWNTAWYNFAPRLGLAWTAHRKEAAETIVRAGGGVFFDTDDQLAANGFNGLGFTASNVIYGGALPVSNSVLESIDPSSVAAPYTNTIPYAFPSHLQLPYTLEWNVSLQQALGQTQAFTLSYVGANGRRLIEQQVLSVSAGNSNFGTVGYIPNGLTSSYNALQVAFQRTIRAGIQAHASYTWSHSLDFGSNDSSIPVIRGNSNFDVRHSVQAAVSWDIPTVNKMKHQVVERALVKNWGLDARLIARSAFPITLQGNTLVNSVTGGEYYSGVDYDSSKPIYLYGPQYPGGRMLNGGPSVINPAFTAPVGTISGNAPRNFVRGFGEWQLNIAARREFPLFDAAKLQFRAEAFNLLNHPNFGYVQPFLTNALFGQATSMLNQSLGSMSPLYQQGGARSMQLALKIVF